MTFSFIFQYRYLAIVTFIDICVLVKYELFDQEALMHDINFLR